MTVEEWVSGDLFEEPETFRPPPPKPCHFRIPRVKNAMLTKEPLVSEIDSIQSDLKLPDDWQCARVPSSSTSCSFDWHITLVGQHSLWAHRVWFAGILMSRYLDGATLNESESTARDKMVPPRPPRLSGQRVLELGAGAGLPSMVAADNHAQLVVACDYPDKELMQRLWLNLARNRNNSSTDMFTVAHVWGKDVSAVQPLSSCFDVILLADLICNHSAHVALCQSVCALAQPGIRLIVSFGYHRPWYAAEDVRFFVLLQQNGWRYVMPTDAQGNEMVMETDPDREDKDPLNYEQMEAVKRGEEHPDTHRLLYHPAQCSYATPPMFEVDRGTLTLRGWVHLRVLQFIGK